jgi:hypothetical protein
MRTHILSTVLINAFIYRLMQPSAGVFASGFVEELALAAVC